MDVSDAPTRRILGILVTTTSLLSLVAFGLASWIAWVELVDKDQAPATRWMGMAMGVFFAVAFSVGPVMSWVEYRRERTPLAVGWAAGPYVALAICWVGVRSLVH